MPNVGLPRNRLAYPDVGQRRTTFLILAVTLLAGTYLTWRILQGTSASSVWSGRALLVSGFLAGLISLGNARRFPEQRTGWLLISSGSVLWTAAHLLRGASDATSALIFTVLFLATAIGLMVGCLRLAGIGGQPGAMRWLVIDLFPPIVSLLTVVWLADIGPFVQTPELRWHYQAAAAMHGLAAVALIVVGLAGLFSWQRLRTHAYVQTMMAGLAIIAVADGFWLQRWIDRTPSFGLAGDVAFCIGFATIAVAGLQVRLVGSNGQRPQRMHPLPPRLGRQSSSMSLILLFVLAGGQAHLGELSPHGIEIAALAGLLVVLFVIMWENLVSVRENVLTEEIDTLSERIDGLISQVGRDPLTGLLNRRAFQDRLEYELASARVAGQPVAIALIDVDNFKGVNDTLGHAVGDQVLQAIASILIGVARASDVASRYAGDEFVMIFPGVDEATASQVSQRVIESVQRINAQLRPMASVQIGLSVGVAVTHSCKRNVAQLVAIADAAMYDAKENGKNRVITVNADTLVTRAWWGSEPSASTDAPGRAKEADRRTVPVRSAS